jgi:L,D-transpeptidase catalytic domain
MRLIRNALAFLPALLLMANTTAPLYVNKVIAARVNNIGLFVTKAIKTADCYTEWNLSAAGLSADAFTAAVKGYNYLLQKKLLHNTNVLTVADYSKPSWEKRLFVLDMNTGKVLFKTLVAHGKNSGLEYATNFSNEEESYKTSLGFFITHTTYEGKNGYSLKLEGCEKGINDKALERAIVMHGAAYANENFLQQNGYLGRSYGCPAVPEKMNKQIIDVIKNGSCLFLYHPTKKYTNTSKILNS